MNDGPAILEYKHLTFWLMAMCRRKGLKFHNEKPRAFMKRFREIRTRMSKENSSTWLHWWHRTTKDF